MNISEHTFDRLDEIFVHKPMSQLIDDDGIKQNCEIGVLKVKIPEKIGKSYCLIA